MALEKPRHQVCVKSQVKVTSWRYFQAKPTPLVGGCLSVNSMSLFSVPSWLETAFASPCSFTLAPERKTAPAVSPSLI
ncbi:MAG: hypothetical protein A2049_05275 [Elusimicrobia bacterium GWA2_62_23]|nr:MAG: hypothetical protein A2049_05275 [Elusimicrobia bacterium GWA2_62_23]OGR68284.1 MAG: hypothetical protein A2179_01880 [Elusimicrobia bacterium GWC2_63_65]